MLHPRLLARSYKFSFVRLFSYLSIRPSIMLLSQNWLIIYHWYVCVYYVYVYVCIDFLQGVRRPSKLESSRVWFFEKKLFFLLIWTKNTQNDQHLRFFYSQKTVFHFCKKCLKWKMWDLSLQGKSYVWKDSCFRDIVKNPLDQSNYKILLKTLSWVIYVLFWLFAPI